MTTNTAGTAREKLIAIRDVSVAYGGRRVLDGVSLDIDRGEIVALAGGSGSGKTTLLRRVIGLERPDSGSIKIDGVDLTTCSEAELAAVRRKIGVAFQENVSLRERWRVSRLPSAGAPQRAERRAPGPRLDVGASRPGHAPAALDGGQLSERH